MLNALTTPTGIRVDRSRFDEAKQVRPIPTSNLPFPQVGPSAFVQWAFTHDGLSFIYAAESLDGNDRWVLKKFAIAGGAPVTIVSGARSTFAVSPDSQHLLYFEAGASQESLGSLFHLPIAGGTATLLTSDAAMPSWLGNTKIILQRSGIPAPSRSQNGTFLFDRP